MVVNAAIAIIIKTPFPIESVYKLINCLANSPPLLENYSPLPYITNAPREIKQIPKMIVVKYPILKSRIISLSFIFFSFFFFSKVHIDCHTETSSGAGIQPIKATKNAISIVSFGNTCVNSNELVVLNPAKKTANKVLTASIIITNFIRLSKSLYFPIRRTNKQIAIIIHAHAVMFDVIPKS